MICDSFGAKLQLSVCVCEWIPSHLRRNHDVGMFKGWFWHGRGFVG